jgi:hypothetical protein
MKSKVGLEREKIAAPSEAHPEVNDQFFVTYLIHLVGGHFFEKRFSLITIRIFFIRQNQRRFAVRPFIDAFHRF